MSTQLTDQQSRAKFVLDYQHLIEARMRQMDSNNHSKTTNARHLNRLRNRVIEDLIKEQSAFGKNCALKLI